MNFFEELRRRNVFKVGVGYIIIAWLLAQVADLMLENFGAPAWVMKSFLGFLIIGFPLAIFFAWAFELTPEGIKKEKDVDRSQSIAPQTGRKLDRSIIIILALALGYFAYDKFLASSPGNLSPPGPVSVEVSEDENSSLTSEQASQLIATDITEKLNPDSFPPVMNQGEKSVAVLPFVNMSDDAQNEYFSDGISEELLNVLVRVPGLRVPSRTSSFTFKGSALKLAEIGRELQVDHILEGSVRKAGDRIRVTAQLIEVDTDTHLWSETYTRKLDDIFAVQDEIAQAIVGALKITLTGKEQAPIQTRSTASVEAYNKYLFGRHLWNQRTPDSLLAAITPLLEALEMDPGFGRAWEALADTYVLIPEYTSGTIKEYIPLAREAIEKALLINPDSARALTTSAYIKFMHVYDFKSARNEFIKAINIEPGYATAHQWYGELLAAEGKLDAAMEELQLAHQADPLAPIMLHVAGWFLLYSDRFEESRQYYERALVLNPNLPNTLGNLAILDTMEGNFDSARQYARQAAAIRGIDPATHLAIIDAVENPALKDKAIALLLADTNYPDGVMLKARMLMSLGEPELTMDSLERGFENGDPYAVHMKRMNTFDPLRENPRFQALLAKMNLWP